MFLTLILAAVSFHVLYVASMFNNLAVLSEHTMARKPSTNIILARIIARARLRHSRIASRKKAADMKPAAFVTKIRTEQHIRYCSVYKKLILILLE